MSNADYIRLFHISSKLSLRRPAYEIQDLFRCIRVDLYKSRANLEPVWYISSRPVHDGDIGMVTGWTARDGKNQLAKRAAHQRLGRCETDPTQRDIKQYNRGP
jgi:hypothetical protein